MSNLTKLFGVSPSGKATGFGPVTQRFDSFYPRILNTFFKMATFHLIDSSLYVTLFVCLVLSLLLSGVILALSFFIAIQTPDPEKTSAYECGFEPFEDARNRFNIRFYIVAILFLIFDIEVAYLFPWASTLGRIGGVGYAVRVFFLLLLTLGFLYEVIKGALNPQ